MRRINLMGDPSVVAQELERAQRHEQRLLTGKSCESCAHGEIAWGEWHCMAGQKLPVCVFRGRYVERSE